MTQQPPEPITGLNLMAERLTTTEALSFWQKNKERIWVVALLVFGAAGGNVDRLYEALPDVYGVAELKKDVAELKEKVKACPCNNAPALQHPVDNEIKVSRP